jgi:polysaccharide export outer membrane protein
MWKIAVLSAAVLLSGCASNVLPPSDVNNMTSVENGEYQYKIGTDDVLSVFVWHNPDISGDYAVTPDGKISMALTKPILAAGKTTEQLSNDLAKELSEYIKNPKVTVMIRSAVGSVSAKVRIVGDAVTPLSVPFHHGMTLLDLMIQIGGMSKYADGNDATLIRIEGGKPKEYEIRIEDLILEADLEANVDLKPGDVIKIPEAWF